MHSSGSGGKLEGFFTGKGFYIVLFLCAAVIGASAWMMAAGNETIVEETGNVNRADVGNRRVETVIVTPQIEVMAPDEEEALEVMAPAGPAEEPMEADASEETGSAPAEEQEQSQPEAVSAPVYAWPVSGEVEREHSVEQLAYDVTMRDWRTHSGVDIAAPLGETVGAARAGSVVSIAEDDLYGTVVTVDHGDGSRAVYANLAASPAVSTGDWVETGGVIGSVGTTALCEIGQGTHLHFALFVDGKSVDPMRYLKG